MCAVFLFLLIELATKIVALTIFTHWIRLLASYFFVSRKATASSVTAPALFYLRASCPNAELTNHKQHDCSDSPRR